jgi:hypothetical protein
MKNSEITSKVQVSPLIKINNTATQMPNPKTVPLLVESNTQTHIHKTQVNSLPKTNPSMVNRNQPALPHQSKS